MNVKIFRSIIIAILGLIFLLQPRVGSAQNIVELGSAQAPIKYIRGTGTNIGLIVGVEFKPGAGIPKSSRVHEVGVLHKRGVAFKSGGQGLGKESALNSGSNSFERKYQNAPLTARTLISVLSLSQLQGEEDKFQILPATRFTLNQTGITEILLPLICHDLYLDVPEPTNQEKFDILTIPETVLNAYLGIYRFDQYLNDHVIQNVWINGDNILYRTSLTEAEVRMITYCEIEVDSTTLNKEPAGYYDITHAHLTPSLANFPVWVATENQDQVTCKAGIDHIWMLNGFPEAPPEVVQAIFELNHLVFSFAEIDSFKNRFPMAGSPSPPAPNLRPYAFIQWNPDAAQQENDQNGVKFSAKLSFDVDDQINSYRWDFGDGATSIEMEPTHKYNRSGSYKVSLIVEDQLGGQAKDTVMVENLVTNVGEQNDLKPESFYLANGFPNPFTKTTRLSLSLTRPEILHIKVYDLVGREVETLFDGRLDAGAHDVEWDGFDAQGREVPAGIYYARISTSTHTQVRKMLLIR